MLIVFLIMLVLAFITLGNLCLYVIAWYEHINFRSKADDKKWRRIRLWPRLWGFFLETVSLWIQVFTTPLLLVYNRHPKKPVKDDRPPVLMVHGWGSGSHSFIFVHAFLKLAGYKNMYAMTYRPILSGAERLAKQVANKIDYITKTTGAEQVDVITHSMGGVLTRYAIKNLGADGKVRKVIALGGPHMGSRLSMFIPMGKNTLQMTYKSDFVTELAKGGMTPGSAQYVSIYSDFDNFVFPTDSSNLGDGAKNIKIPLHGHNYLLYSPTVMGLIKQELKTS